VSDPKWEALFAALSEDINDRRGLKWEWRKIDEEVMSNEIKPAWRRIIEAHI
jgi:hypothetical protein